MSLPKLYYYPVQARAELIRYVLAAGNIEYEEENDVFKTYKNDSPFGQVPYMEIEGKSYAQSFALAKYFAKKVGLLGSTDLEELEIVSYADYILLDCAEVCIMAHMPKYFVKEITNERLGEIKEDNLKRYITATNLLEKLSKGDFLLGDKMTFADIALAFAYQFGNAYLPVDFRRSLSDKINSIVDRVNENEGIKDYICKRSLPVVLPRPN